MPRYVRCFAALRKRILTQPRAADAVRAEVLKMRDKMKAHLGTSTSQKKRWHFSFKTGCRVVSLTLNLWHSMQCLRGVRSNPDLAHFSDNVRILEDAAKLGCLSSEDASALIQAYLSETNREPPPSPCKSKHASQPLRTGTHHPRDRLPAYGKDSSTPNAAPLVMINCTDYLVKNWSMCHEFG